MSRRRRSPAHGPALSPAPAPVPSPPAARPLAAWLPLAGVAVLALVLRLVYLSELAGSPLLSGLMGDSRQYDAWAQQIAGGQWMGTEVFYQTPLYPYWMAVIFSVAGHSLDVVRGVQAVLGAASCVLLGLAGRRFFSERVGLVAALLLAVYPPAFFFDGLIQKSSLDILLVTAVLALVAEFAARRHWAWLAALGAAAALLTLNRENARILYLVIGAWLWFGFRDVPARRRLAWGAVVIAATLAVLLPVGLRNYRVGGEFLISTSQLGPNFYIGNNPTASGSYEPLAPERGDAMYEREDATRIASTAAGRPLSPSQVSDYWLDRALDYIRSQPLDWVGLLGRKLFYTLNAAELPDTESIEAYAEYSGLLRILLWLNFGVALPLAVLGAWLHRADWKRLWVLYGVFVGLVVAVAAFYVVARYRHPIVPVVLLFAAAGLSGLTRLRQQRGWLTGLACAAAVAVVANIPVRVAADQSYLNAGTLLLQNGNAAEAIPVLTRATRLDPAHAEPHYRLGLAYQETGNLQGAVDELTRTIRLRPEHGEAHNALGLLLRGQDRAAEALVEFRDAAKYAPNSVEAHSNLGLALTEAGQFDEAIAEHRRAVALAPGKASPHNNLAIALQQAGQVTQAIAEFRAALAIQADNREAHANLALALASAGDNAAAVVHFREAIRLFSALPADTPGRAEAIKALEDALRPLEPAAARRR